MGDTGNYDYDNQAYAECAARGTHQGTWELTEQKMWRFACSHCGAWFERPALYSELPWDNSA